MMHRLTKTFTENRLYRRTVAGQFIETAAAEPTVPLDEQVREWVTTTGNIIIHPGQLGMHTVWHGSKKDPYQVKCVTLGLTVLYQENSHGGQYEQRDTTAAEHADPAGIDPGADTV